MDVQRGSAALRPAELDHGQAAAGRLARSLDRAQGAEEPARVALSGVVRDRCNRLGRGGAHLISPFIEQRWLMKSDSTPVRRICQYWMHSYGWRNDTEAQVRAEEAGRRDGRDAAADHRGGGRAARDGRAGSHDAERGRTACRRPAPHRVPPLPHGRRAARGVLGPLLDGESVARPRGLARDRRPAASARPRARRALRLLRAHRADVQQRPARRRARRRRPPDAASRWRPTCTRRPRSSPPAGAPAVDDGKCSSPRRATPSTSSPGARSRPALASPGSRRWSSSLRSSRPRPLPVAARSPDDTNGAVACDRSSRVQRR